MSYAHLKNSQLRYMAASSSIRSLIDGAPSQAPAPPAAAAQPSVTHTVSQQAVHGAAWGIVVGTWILLCMLGFAVLSCRFGVRAVLAECRDLCESARAACAKVICWERKVVQAHMLPELVPLRAKKHDSRQVRIARPPTTSYLSPLQQQASDSGQVGVMRDVTACGAAHCFVQAACVDRDDSLSSAVLPVLLRSMSRERCTSAALPLLDSMATKPACYNGADWSIPAGMESKDYDQVDEAAELLAASALHKYNSAEYYCGLSGVLIPSVS